ncbi:MAG: glutamine--tRNA ligase/YqeY domain fusion protein [Candidatus Competibacteraceae bacterium]|nr:glutamine--tRNA ligase/YqeY domain fusion protein [Candidatus Competibacteraceae bacterium]
MSDTPRPSNFIRNIIQEDLAAGRNDGRLMTRFPPEPNGYLHIGHAKAICLNFGLAGEFKGLCNLRFDDTNPAKESMEYVESIQESVSWLGFSWDERLYFASDYFERLYHWAEELIHKGLAYVDDQSAEEIRASRGTLTEPGRESPHRNRSPQENLELFRRMKAGEFPDGSRVLRAKIDMAAPNINMRDPALYRIIRDTPHYRRGREWKIYPMYDFTQPLSDAIEGVTHSLCTLEFEDHRPLYDWVIENLSTPSRPHQYEFARLNLQYTVMSKRKLNELVRDGHVEGWDDPRLPTVSGMRRRGFTPAAIRDFCERIGITKKDASIEMSLLENSVREDLDRTAPRAMGVLRPLKVVITNYPEGQMEEFEAPNHPRNPQLGTRLLPFSRELYIEADDFMEEAPRKFHRLKPDGEVRLRFAYIIRCQEVIKDGSGQVVELRCSYDPDTRSGLPGAERKVKGTIHWVSAPHGVRARVRLYDRLFTVPNPGGDKQRDFKELLNPNSRVVLEDCRLEPALAEAAPEERFQFERLGYFCADRREHGREQPVFNRTVTLRDSWAKLEQQARGG